MRRAFRGKIGFYNPVSLRPAIFLDRDGVIIEEVGYLSSPDEVRLIDGAANAIARLNLSSIAVVVATNQSGVARGYFPESRVHRVHARLDELLAIGGAGIDGYFHCPHHPTAGREPYRRECDCRKPRSGLLTLAAGRMDLDLSRSILIGDKLTDLQAGAAAGCRTILVRTGHGTSVKEPLEKNALRLWSITNDLAAAVDLLLPSILALSGGIRRSRPA